MGDDAGRDSIYAFGSFCLDARTHILKNNGKKVDLDVTPMEVLLALVERAGEPVSKGDLLRRVWGDTTVSNDSIYQHISVLRKALGERPKQNEYIRTVPRRGYQFVPPVETFRTGPAGPSAQAPTRKNPDEPAPIGKYISEDGVPYEIISGFDPSYEDPLCWELSTSPNQVQKDTPSLKKRPGAKRKARRRHH
jgi:DNA-binding winged helix-turn-helix (wHTH) protein